MHAQACRLALALVSLMLLSPSHAAAAENEDVAELRRQIRALQQENRELSRRVGTLEGAREGPRAPPKKPAAAPERATPATTGANLPPVAAPPSDAQRLPGPRDTTGIGLKERVNELEVGWAAQEHATRQIIQDAVSKLGPKINSFLALSGVVEVLGARTRDFNSLTRDKLDLNTVELDFDVKVSDWLRGAVVLNWEAGSSAVTPTTSVTAPGVDRFTLDRTHISVGDFTLFPIGVRTGREALHFGTTTGVARLDTLSIGSPLTTEVFENRQTYVGIEFALPTPGLQPRPAPIVIPPSQPLVIAPVVSRIMRWVGYVPLPQRPIVLKPVTPPFPPSPFYGSFAVYKGSEEVAPDRRFIQDFNASLGYRTSGHCGVPYEQLRQSLVCPWQIDIHVDYNTSIFDSKFLRASYLQFLPQIGAVPGMAASAKASFGPFAVVAEINRTIREVSFFDATGALKEITPTTWQFSLAYQFDWNPWLTEIGAQGNFISVAYSGSKDMAGAIGLVDGKLTRIGFVPQSRLIFTWGEWVMDGLKVALEQSINWDYPVSEGGTGQVVYGTFGLVQLNF